MTDKQALEELGKFLDEYWAACKKPLSLSIINRRYYRIAKSAGTTIGALIYVLQHQGAAHMMLVDSGARYLVPKGAWDEMGEAQRYFLARDLGDPKAALKRSKDEMPVAPISRSSFAPSKYYETARSERDELNAPSEARGTVAVPGSWED